jgi:meso-butanediol dehydrogenase/(S,S)-butanediol dehydrogenase/diacetyl reductase
MSTEQARRTAIVTGAASGIGRAVCERLAADGWRTIGIDLVDGSLPGGNLLVGDAGDPALLTRAVDAAGSRLDGLVCAAGLPPHGPWDDPARWEETIRVDLSAPFHALRIVFPSLRAAGGSVVLIGSIVGTIEGSSRSPAYAAAKAGLEGLARSAALIGGGDGVRVNVVAPGAIDTPLDEPLLSPDARSDVPLARMGRAEEVAGVVAWLLGPDATYVTGAVVRVDGGRGVLNAAEALAGQERPAGDQRGA